MDEALLARVEKQALFHRYPRGLPVAAFVFGMLVTILFVINLERSDAMTRRVTLEADATALTTELEREADENIAYLRAAASLFAASDSVTPAEFAGLVTDMSSGHAKRGALGLGWAEWVDAANAPILEADRARYEPGVAFKVRPVPTSATRNLAVVTLLEPRSPANDRVIGFDMYSEPVRHVAIDDAMRLRVPTASGKVHLIQDAGNTNIAGTLIYFPVFGRPGADGNAPSRPKGFVYAPVRAQDFLNAAIAGARRNPGRIELYDGAVKPDNLLARSAMRAGRDRETMTRSLDIAGRHWTLLVASRTRLGLTRTSIVILILGTLISFLMLSLARVATVRAADDRKVLEWLTQQESIRNSLTRELNHRVKNTLANVLSIVALTRRRSRDIDTFAEGLTGRLRALSATHDLLSQSDWSNAAVHDIVTSELVPYLDPEDPHATISGPHALMAPNDAMSLGLALHELATNSTKYGALSSPTGRVSVTWTIPTPGRCEIHWRETGGPRVTAPSRRGFGIDLIEKVVSHELGSQVDLRFDPEGVNCTLTVPLRNQRTFTLRENAPSRS